MKKSFDKKWENNVYSKGKQINSYPFDILVSIVARKFFHFFPKDRKNIRVLDLGCGAGNNAKFFAENGFSVFGIDGSKSALSFCRKIFKKNKLKGNFARGDFLNLPYKDNFFDLIVDRESLYANRPADIKKIIDEIFKRLKPGGYFVSFMFNNMHSAKANFIGTGRVHLVNLNEILDWFSEFKIENVARHSLLEVHDKSHKFMEFDEYIIIAKKP